MLPSNIDRVQRHSSPNNHKEEVLMKVSMNDIIKVKLNKIGDELLQKVFGNSQELPKKDPDGYTEMKFLYLLKMFEDFEYLGEVNKPFDGDVIVIA